MATASASLVPVVATGAAVTSYSKSHQKRTKKVVYLRGMNAYQGLKAHTSLVSLGVRMSTDQAFFNVVSSLRAPIAGRGGGATAARCNAVAEIFKIAAIMNGLVLVGVAVGFVLLRIEAFVEESEE